MSQRINLSLNCLISPRNQQLLSMIKDNIKSGMLDMVAAGKNPFFSSVYNKMTDDGIEVDMESAAYLYSETVAQVLPQLRGLLSNANDIFTTDKELETMVGKREADTIKSINTLTPPSGTTQSISGQLNNSQMTIANTLTRLFAGDVLGLRSANVKTELRQVQDAVSAYAKTLLDKTASTKKATDFERIFAGALAVEDVDNANDINGESAAMSLFGKVKEELKKISNKLTAAEKAQLEAYVSNIEQATYISTLSSGDAKKALRDILKKAGFKKTVTSNGVKSEVVDWNKLAQQNPDLQQTISDIVDASPSNYSQKQKNIIVKTLMNEYDNIRVSAQQRTAQAVINKRNAAINDANFIENVTSQVALSKGMFKMQNGVRVVDYSPPKMTPEFRKELLDEVQAISPQLPYAADDTFLNTEAGIKQAISDVVRNDIANDKFNGSVANLRGILSKMNMQNNTKSVVKPSDLQRLSKLKSMGAFNTLYTDTLVDTMGIPVDGGTIREMQQLVAKFEKVIANGEMELTKATKNSDGNNRYYALGKQSQYAMAEIAKQMDRLIERSMKKRGKDSKLPKGVPTFYNIARTLSHITDLSLAYRLANFKNILQNGIEGFMAVLLNPKGLITNKKDRNLFLQTLSDVFTAGVDYTSSQGDLNVFNNQVVMATPNKNWKEKLTAFLKTYPNAALSAIDAATHAYRAKTVLASVLKKNMLANGYTKEDADTFINETLYGKKNWDTAKKIALENLQIAFDKTKIPKAILYRETVKIMEGMVLNGTYFSEERLATLQQVANNFALESLGKKSTLAINGTSLNVFENLRNIKSTGRNAILDKYLKTKDKKYLNRLAVYDLAMIPIFGSVLQYASGAFNWGVIGAKQLGLGFLSIGTVMGNSKKSDAILHSEMVAANLDDKDMNRADITNGLARYYRDLENIRQGVQGWLFAAATYAVFLVTKGDDEDEDEFLEWLKKKQGNSKLFEIYKTYLGGAIIRVASAYNDTKESLFISKEGAALSALFNVRTPTSPAEFIEKVMKGPSKELAGIVGTTASNIALVPTMVNSALSYTPDGNNFNVKVDAKDHPLLRDENGDNKSGDFFNAFMTSFLGYTTSRFLEYRTERMGKNSFPILKDSKAEFDKVTPRQLSEKIMNKKINQVNWEELGVDVKPEKVNQVARLNPAYLLKKGLDAETFKPDNYKKKVDKDNPEDDGKIEWGTLFTKQEQDAGYSESNVKMFFDFIKLKKQILAIAPPPNK